MFIRVLNLYKQSYYSCAIKVISFNVAVTQAVDTLTLANCAINGVVHHTIYEFTVEATGVQVAFQAAILNQFVPSLLPSKVSTGAVVIAQQFTAIERFLHPLVINVPVAELRVVSTIALSILCRITGVVCDAWSLFIALVNDGVVPDIVWT